MGTLDHPQTITTTNMTYLNEKAFTIGTLVLAFALASWFLFAPGAGANPASYTRQQSAAATSTLAYIQPDTATTTLATLDSQGGNTFALNASAVLALQLLGSSSPSGNGVGAVNYATTTFNIGFEYSQDGIDWYRAAATSTESTSVGPTFFNITLGTTTQAGLVLSTTTPTKRLVTVPTPTRFVRPVISIPGGTNGAVWGEWVAQKQVQ